MEPRERWAWVLLLGTLVLWAAKAAPLTIDEIDAREWHVKAVEIAGNEALWTSTLKAEVLTQPRAWYMPWKSRPVCDPTTLQADLQRLRRSTEPRGNFEARTVYQL